MGNSLSCEAEPEARQPLGTDCPSPDLSASTRPAESRYTTSKKTNGTAPVENPEKYQTETRASPDVSQVTKPLMQLPPGIARRDLQSAAVLSHAVPIESAAETAPLDPALSKNNSAFGGSRPIKHIVLQKPDDKRNDHLNKAFRSYLAMTLPDGTNSIKFPVPERWNDPECVPPSMRTSLSLIEETLHGLYLDSDLDMWKQLSKISPHATIIGTKEEGLIAYYKLVDPLPEYNTHFAHATYSDGMFELEPTPSAQAGFRKVAMGLDDETIWNRLGSHVQPPLPPVVSSAEPTNLDGILTKLTADSRRQLETAMRELHVVVDNVNDDGPTVYAIPNKKGVVEIIKFVSSHVQAGTLDLPSKRFFCDMLRRHDRYLPTFGLIPPSALTLEYGPSTRYPSSCLQAVFYPSQRLRHHGAKKIVMDVGVDSTFSTSLKEMSDASAPVNVYKRICQAVRNETEPVRRRSMLMCEPSCAICGVPLSNLLYAQGRPDDPDAVDGQYDHVDPVASIAKRCMAGVADPSSVLQPPPNHDSFCACPSRDKARASLQGSGRWLCGVCHAGVTAADNRAMAASQPPTPFVSSPDLHVYVAMKLLGVPMDLPPPPPTLPTATFSPPPSPPEEEVDPTPTLVRCLSDEPSVDGCKYLWQIEQSFYVSSSCRDPEHRINEVTVFPSDANGEWHPTPLASISPSTVDRAALCELVKQAFRGEPSVYQAYNDPDPEARPVKRPNYLAFAHSAEELEWYSSDEDTPPLPVSYTSMYDPGGTDEGPSTRYLRARQQQLRADREWYHQWEITSSIPSFHRQEAPKRRSRHLQRWRTAILVVGALQSWWKRAEERCLTPGGPSYHDARLHFESMVSGEGQPAEIHCTDPQEPAETFVPVLERELRVLPPPNQDGDTEPTPTSVAAPSSTSSCILPAFTTQAVQGEGSPPRTSMGTDPDMAPPVLNIERRLSDSIRPGPDVSPVRARRGIQFGVSDFFDLSRDTLDERCVYCGEVVEPTDRYQRLVCCDHPNTCAHSRCWLSLNTGSSSSRARRPRECAVVVNTSSWGMSAAITFNEPCGRPLVTVYPHDRSEAKHLQLREASPPQWPFPALRADLPASYEGRRRAAVIHRGGSKSGLHRAALLGLCSWSERHGRHWWIGRAALSHPTPADIAHSDPREVVRRFYHSGRARPSIASLSAARTGSTGSATDAPGSYGNDTQRLGDREFFLAPSEPLDEPPPPLTDPLRPPPPPPADREPVYREFLSRLPVLEPLDLRRYDPRFAAPPGPSGLSPPAAERPSTAALHSWLSGGPPDPPHLFPPDPPPSPPEDRRRPWTPPADLREVIDHRRRSPDRPPAPTHVTSPSSGSDRLVAHGVPVQPATVPPPRAGGRGFSQRQRDFSQRQRDRAARRSFSNADSAHDRPVPRPVSPPLIDALLDPSPLFTPTPLSLPPSMGPTMVASTPLPARAMHLGRCARCGDDVWADQAHVTINASCHSGGCAHQHCATELRRPILILNETEYRAYTRIGLPFFLSEGLPDQLRRSTSAEVAERVLFANADASFSQRFHRSAFRPESYCSWREWALSGETHRTAAADLAALTNRTICPPHGFAVDGTASAAWTSYRVTFVSALHDALTTGNDWATILSCLVASHNGPGGSGPFRGHRCLEVLVERALDDRTLLRHPMLHADVLIFQMDALFGGWHPLVPANADVWRHSDSSSQGTGVSSPIPGSPVHTSSPTPDLAVHDGRVGTAVGPSALGGARASVGGQSRVPATTGAWIETWRASLLKVLPAMPAAPTAQTIVMGLALIAAYLTPSPLESSTSVEPTPIDAMHTPPPSPPPSPSPAADSPSATTEPALSGASPADSEPALSDVVMTTPPSTPAPAPRNNEWPADACLVCRSRPDDPPDPAPSSQQQWWHGTGNVAHNPSRCDSMRSMLTTANSGTAAGASDSCASLATAAVAAFVQKMGDPRITVDNVFEQRTHADTINNRYEECLRADAARAQTRRSEPAADGARTQMRPRELVGADGARVTRPGEDIYSAARRLNAAYLNAARRRGEEVRTEIILAEPKPRDLLPRLENWSVITKPSDDPYQCPQTFGTTVLHGNAYGHPDRPDGHFIRTSALLYQRGDLARTASRWFHLGAPAEGFAAYMEAEGKPVKSTEGVRCNTHISFEPDDGSAPGSYRNVTVWIGPSDMQKIHDRFMAALADEAVSRWQPLDDAGNSGWAPVPPDSADSVPSVPPSPPGSLSSSRAVSPPPPDELEALVSGDFVDASAPDAASAAAAPATEPPPSALGSEVAPAPADISSASAAGSSLFSEVSSPVGHTTPGTREGQASASGFDAYAAYVPTPRPVPADELGNLSPRSLLRHSGELEVYIQACFLEIHQSRTSASNTSAVLLTTQAQRDEALEEVDRLSRAADVARTALVASQDRVVVLDQAHNTALENSNLLSEELKKLQLRFDEAQAMKSISVERQKEHLGTIARLEDELTILRSKYERSNQSREQLLTQVAAYEDHSRHHSSKEADADNRVEKLEDELELRTREVESCKEEMESINARLSVLSDEARALHERISLQSHELEEARAAQASLQSACEEAETETRAANEAYWALLAARTRVDAECTRVENELRATAVERDAFRAECVDLRARRDAAVTFVSPVAPALGTVTAPPTTALPSPLDTLLAAARAPASPPAPSSNVPPPVPPSATGPTPVPPSVTAPALTSIPTPAAAPAPAVQPVPEAVVDQPSREVMTLGPDGLFRLLSIPTPTAAPAPAVPPVTEAVGLGDFQEQEQLRRAMAATSNAQPPDRDDDLASVAGSVLESPMYAKKLAFFNLPKEEIKAKVSKSVHRDAARRVLDAPVDHTAMKWKRCNFFEPALVSRWAAASSSGHIHRMASDAIKTITTFRFPQALRGSPAEAAASWNATRSSFINALHDCLSYGCEYDRVLRRLLGAAQHAQHGNRRVSQLVTAMLQDETGRLYELFPPLSADTLVYLLDQTWQHGAYGADSVAAEYDNMHSRHADDSCTSLATAVVAAYVQKLDNSDFTVDNVWEQQTHVNMINTRYAECLEADEASMARGSKNRRHFMARWNYWQTMFDAGECDFSRLDCRRIAHFELQTYEAAEAETTPVAAGTSSQAPGQPAGQGRRAARRATAQAAAAQPVTDVDYDADEQYVANVSPAPSAGKGTPSPGRGRGKGGPSAVPTASPGKGTPPLGRGGGRGGPSAAPNTLAPVPLSGPRQPPPAPGTAAGRHSTEPPPSFANANVRRCSPPAAGLGKPSGIASGEWTRDQWNDEVLVDFDALDALAPTTAGDAVVHARPADGTFTSCRVGRPRSHDGVWPDDACAYCKFPSAGSGEHSAGPQ